MLNNLYSSSPLILHQVHLQVSLTVLVVYFSTADVFSLSPWLARLVGSHCKVLTAAWLARLVGSHCKVLTAAWLARLVDSHCKVLTAAWLSNSSKSLLSFSSDVWGNPLYCISENLLGSRWVKSVYNVAGVSKRWQMLSGTVSMMTKCTLVL
jgi:hypothetical protein